MNLCFETDNKNGTANKLPCRLIKYVPVTGNHRVLIWPVYFG